MLPRIPAAERGSSRGNALRISGQVAPHLGRGTKKASRRMDRILEREPGLRAPALRTLAGSTVARPWHDTAKERRERDGIRRTLSGQPDRAQASPLPERSRLFDEQREATRRRSTRALQADQARLMRIRLFDWYSQEMKAGIAGCHRRSLEGLADDRRASPAASPTWQEDALLAEMEERLVQAAEESALSALPARRDNGARPLTQTAGSRGCATHRTASGGRWGKPESGRRGGARPAACDLVRALTARSDGVDRAQGFSPAASSLATGLIPREPYLRFVSAGSSPIGFEGSSPGVRLDRVARFYQGARRWRLLPRATSVVGAEHRCRGSARRLPLRRAGGVWRARPEQDCTWSGNCFARPANVNATDFTENDEIC